MDEMNALEKRKILHAMLDIVLDVNGLNARQRSKTDILPTAFFEFIGHTGQVSVRLCKTGWYPACREMEDNTYYANEVKWEDAKELSDHIGETIDFSAIPEKVIRAEIEEEQEKVRAHQRLIGELLKQLERYEDA